MNSLRTPLALLALVLAVALAACGGDDDATTGSSGSGGSGFPVKIAHKLGTTSIPKEPKRVVTLGLTDQDAVLALGVKPVAVTDWYGDKPNATWEWANDRFGASKPTILAKGEFTGNQKYDYEEIIKLKPDLILALYGGVTKKQYDTLKKIAPTVLQPKQYVDYGIPWQAATRVTGKALGKADQADALVKKVDARFAKVREDHPEWKGRSGVVAERGFGDGESFARGPQDPRTRFITAMGFELPANIAKLAGKKDGTAIADERISLLDQDLLLWNIGFAPKKVQAELEDFALYERTKVARDNRAVFVTDPTASAALTWSSVLSVPFALDEVVPQIEKAQAGGES